MSFSPWPLISLHWVLIIYRLIFSRGYFFLSSSSLWTFIWLWFLTRFVVRFFCSHSLSANDFPFCFPPFFLNFGESCTFPPSWSFPTLRKGAFSCRADPLSISKGHHPYCIPSRGHRSHRPPREECLLRPSPKTTYCREGTRAECQTFPGAPMIQDGVGLCVCVSWSGSEEKVSNCKAAYYRQLFLYLTSPWWVCNLLSSPGFQKDPGKLQ